MAARRETLPRPTRSDSGGFEIRCRVHGLLALVAQTACLPFVLSLQWNWLKHPAGARPSTKILGSLLEPSGPHPRFHVFGLLFPLKWSLRATYGRYTSMAWQCSPKIDHALEEMSGWFKDAGRFWLGSVTPWYEETTLTPCNRAQPGGKKSRFKGSHLHGTSDTILEISCKQG